METKSRSLKQRAYEQLREFFLIVVYLWLVFGLLAVYKSIILAEQHIDFAYHGLALINALALGKVMLIAKDFHLGERFNDAPLIYPTVLKAGLFAVVLAGFKILEESAIGLYRGNSFSQSISDLGGGSWKAILTLTLLLFVVLIPFVGFEELQRVLGAGKLKQLLWSPRPPQNQSTTVAA